MFFINFLLSRPVARVSGIAFINSSRSWSKKSYIVLSVSAYDNSCCIFCTGFALYFVTVPNAPEVAPVIVSPFSNSCWEEMNSLLLARSSTRTVAVALEVPPLIVSLTVNLPLEPELVS